MPTMNGFNRSYMYRSTETEKKGRKLRNHRDYACKCFPSFIKFHYYDCPALMKPCPIHGNFAHNAEKQQKGDREQNVVISFHPSTKTERLLQPIKTFLGHCNSETKINFQYYSAENANGKESVKPQNGQNAYESLKKSLNNNIFVGKTKSFVANKTNKVKKLKQCFHSPCNSIVQKTRSQTSIKEKLNQILQEEAKQTRDVFYNLVPEIPPDEKTWLSSKQQDFLPDEKSDSDFVTVTQQDKTNTIHHKIFEIKHRKGLNDIPFDGFPQQQTHLVYSTVNVRGGKAVRETRGSLCECKDPIQEKRLGFDKTASKNEEMGKGLDPCPSEKTNGSINSSSSGSVYISPFIFVPKGMEDSDTEIKSKVRDIDAAEIGIQVEDLPTPKQTATPKESLTSLTCKESCQASKPSARFHNHEETKCHSVLLQTDSFLYEERICHSSRRLCETQWTSRVEEIGSHERAVMTRNYDDESSRQSKRSEMSRRTVESTHETKDAEMQTCSDHSRVRTPESCRYTKTTEMQTCSYHSRVRTPESCRHTKTTEMQTCSDHSRVRTPESCRHTKTTEMQTCSGIVYVRTSDSGRCTKTTEIQTCSSILMRTPDSAPNTKTTEIQTYSCSPSMRTPDSGRRTRTIEPGSITPRTEVLVQARWGTRDKTSQTEDLFNLQVSVKTFDSAMNKWEGSENYTTPLQLSTKGIQTSFYHSSSTEREFIHLRSPEVTYVIKPFEKQDSDQDMDKLAKKWWGKSHSDSDLYERLKCVCCKPDNDLSLLSDDSKNSGMNNTPEKNTVSKIYEPGAFGTGMENCPTLGNVTVKTKETVQRFSSPKQTCTREEELSAAVSDLSELKKIIQEFFEKGNLSSKKTCECGRAITKEEKVDAETMTDSSISPLKQEQKTTFFVHIGLQTNLEGKGKKRNATVQTCLYSPEKIEAATQVEFLKEPKKNDTEAQTSVKVLLEEAEQEKDNSKIKLRHTFVIDKANQSKTFFVCAVCGRDVKHSIDAETNTSSSPERPKLVAVGTECAESFEVKVITKKVQSKDNSKATKETSAMTSERPNDRNDKAVQKTMRQQEDAYRPESSYKTKIPVPSHNTSVHFKNTEATFQRFTDFPATVLSQQRSTVSRGSQKALDRECICDEVGVASTSKDLTPPRESTTSNSKATNSETYRKEYPENSRKSYHGERNKSKRNNQEYYPVLVTHFWPKEIVKTWKSMETAMSGIPSSDDAKSQTTTQKRSYTKDLETMAAAGKKMKVDGNHLSQEFPPELSDLFRQIRSNNFMPCTLKTQEDEKNSIVTDEEAVKKLAQSLRGTSLEIVEDLLQDSLHYSDSNNSFSSDEEDDEESVRETTAKEHSERHNAASSQTHKLKPLSHSEVTFNAPPSPEDATTSKSLNTFLIIINPKKHKIFRRKRSK